MKLDMYHKSDELPSPPYVRSHGFCIMLCTSGDFLRNQKCFAGDGRWRWNYVLDDLNVLHDSSRLGADWADSCNDRKFPNTENSQTLLCGGTQIENRFHRPYVDYCCVHAPHLDYTVNASSAAVA